MPGDRVVLSIRHLRKASTVSGNPKELPTHIAAYLQATHPDTQTKACKKAAIFPTRQSALATVLLNLYYGRVDEGTEAKEYAGHKKQRD